MEDTMQRSIRSTLEATRPGVPGAVLDALSQSVARTVSFDPVLSGLSREVILAGVSESGTSERHAQILAAIRTYAEKYCREKEAIENRKLTSKNEDTVSKGFLLQCWYAFRKDGDVCAVRALTVKFLANWIIRNGKYIQQDEKDWCARQAVADAQDEDLEPEQKEARQTAAYAEAVVLLVMHKFDRAYRREPEKYGALFEAMRQEYEDYSARRFGFPPDWTVPDYRRPQATKAFLKAASDKKWLSAK